MAIFEYSNSHTVKEAAEAIKLLKGTSLLISQQRNSALNHIGVSQILYKYVLRRSKNTISRFFKRTIDIDSPKTKNDCWNSQND